MSEVEKLEPILQKAFKEATRVYLTDNGLNIMATSLIESGVAVVNLEEKSKQVEALKALKLAATKPPKGVPIDPPTINKQLIDAANLVCSLFSI
jgi:hypothetical protein